MKWRTLKTVAKMFFGYFIAALLAFQPTAFALGANRNIQNFLNESGLIKGEAKLQDIYLKYRNAFPSHVRAAIEETLRQDPDFKLPKMNVTKLDNGELRVSYVVEDQSASITFNNQSGVMRIGDQKINPADYLESLAMTQQIEKGLGVGKNWLWPSAVHDYKVVVMPWDSFKNQKPEHQKQYIHYLRELADFAEQMNPAPKQKTVQNNWILELLLTDAVALDKGDVCYIGGNESTIGVLNGQKICGATGTSSEVECNPLLYGTDNGKPYKVSALSAAKKCDELGKGYSPTNEEELKRLRLFIDSMQAKVAEKCTAFGNGLLGANGKVERYKGEAMKASGIAKEQTAANKGKPPAVAPAEYKVEIANSEKEVLDYTHAHDACLASQTRAKALNAMTYTVNPTTKAVTCEVAPASLSTILSNNANPAQAAAANVKVAPANASAALPTVSVSTSTATKVVASGGVSANNPNGATHSADACYDPNCIAAREKTGVATEVGKLGSGQTGAVQEVGAPNQNASPQVTPTGASTNAGVDKYGSGSKSKTPGSPPKTKNWLQRNLWVVALSAIVLGFIGAYALGSYLDRRNKKAQNANDGAV